MVKPYIFSPLNSHGFHRPKDKYYARTQCKEDPTKSLKTGHLLNTDFTVIARTSVGESKAFQFYF